MSYRGVGNQTIEIWTRSRTQRLFDSIYNHSPEHPLLFAEQITNEMNVKNLSVEFISAWIDSEQDIELWAMG